MTTENTGNPSREHKQCGSRAAFLISYDGTDFVGFQFQKNGRSVQATMEEALFRLYGKCIRIHGCSRTDAGVHAFGHVFHADVPFFIPQEKLPPALNTFLPEDLAVLKAAYVPDDFHARFGAVGKQYAYRIWNDPIRPVIDRQYMAHVPVSLRLESMRRAASLLEGEHDFSAFCAAGGTAANPVRHVESVTVDTLPPGAEVRITVRGRSFLYNMVRIMAGTLVYVGLGKMAPEDILRPFAEKDRRLSGKTMPAKGLVLEKVFFDREWFSI